MQTTCITPLIPITFRDRTTTHRTPQPPSNSSYNSAGPLGQLSFGKLLQLWHCRSRRAIREHCRQVWVPSLSRKRGKRRTNCQSTRSSGLRQTVTVTSSVNANGLIGKGEWSVEFRSIARCVGLVIIDVKSEIGCKKKIVRAHVKRGDIEKLVCSKRVMCVMSRFFFLNLISDYGRSSVFDLTCGKSMR